MTKVPYQSLLLPATHHLNSIIVWGRKTKKGFASLRLCVSSLHRDHANLLCIFKRVFNVAARRLDNEIKQSLIYKPYFTARFNLGISWKNLLQRPCNRVCWWNITDACLQQYHTYKPIMSSANHECYLHNKWLMMWRYCGIVLRMNVSSANHLINHQ